MTIRRPPQSLQEKAYRQILSGITKGEFGPRERLIASKLAEKFGMSRTPVREALHQLKAQGLLDSFDDGSMVIKDFSQKDMEDLYDVRETLECLALELAIDRYTPRDLIAVEKCEEQLEEAIREGDLKKAHRLGKRFHKELLCVFSRNKILIDLIDSLRNTTVDHIFLKTANQQDWHEKFVEHHRIIEALRKKDKATAREALLIDLRMGEAARLRWYR